MAHSKKARQAASKEANAQKPGEPKRDPKPAEQKPQSQSQSQPQPQDPVSSTDQFLETLLKTLYKTWLQLRRMADFVMSELGGNEFVESLATWCAHNPHIAICLLAAGLVFLLPFLIIFGFGIATMLMTFTGLLVLEGTLLTIVSMVFFACLGGFVIIVPLFGVAAVAAYFGFAQVYGLYGGMERHKSALVKFVRDQGKGEEHQPAAVTMSEEPTSTT